MPALLVLNYDVHNHDALARYRDVAAAVILGGTARLVTSTDDTRPLPESPSATGTHTVVLCYRSTVEALRRYESEEYQAVVGERLRATTPRSAFVVDVTHPEALTAFGQPALERLRRDRERLEALREDDWHLICDELRDGLGSLLAGVALQLQALTNAVDADPAEARDLAERARAGISTALEDVRRIVRDRRPEMTESHP